MSYPAYDAIGHEIGLGYARWRVYMALQPPTLDFVTPKDVKIAWLCAELRMSPRKAIDAVNWLTERGYLVAHGRGARGVRSLRLAYSVDRAAA